jgi:hypothetical protein
MADQAGGPVTRRERWLVALAAAALTTLLLYPISIHPGRHARADSSDGQFSLWNVAWVARTIVADPVHLFDANIFHPHRAHCCTRKRTWWPACWRRRDTGRRATRTSRTTRSCSLCSSRVPWACTCSRCT